MERRTRGVQAPPRHDGPFVALELLGTNVEVRLSGSGALHLKESITRAWDRCLARDGDSPEVVLSVTLDSVPAVDRTRDERTTVTGSDEIQLMDQLATRLNLEALKARVGELLLLHACAVAEPASGATVVLVAPSGTGKTTASIALGRRFGYLSDEIAAIRPDGTMLAYPKPLSVLVDGQRPKRQVSPGELGLLEAPPGPWLAAIALLDRTPGPGRPVVARVRTVEALPAVAAQSSSLHLLDKPLHLVAGMLQRTGGLRRITYNDADDLVPVVAALMRKVS